MIRTMSSMLPLAATLFLSLTAQGTEYQERIDVEWVLVPVVVREAHPKRARRADPVPGLEVDDFTLSVDGRSVAIESFEASADAPVRLVYLQDLSGSMALGGKLESSRRALDCFLERTRPGDELALATFAGGKIRVEVPFTADVAVLGEAMAAWRGYGTTALHDAVAWLPEVSVGDRGVRRAVVLVTDGADNASVLAPARARDLVRRARLPVYVLGLDTGSPFDVDSEGRKRHRHADVLNLLAHLTGGRYHPVVEPREIDAMCRAVDRELRSQYVLGFAAGGSGSVRFRSLEVKVSGKTFDVQHRRGYSGRAPISISD